MFELQLLDLSAAQFAAAGLIFVWSGFVRAGLGFGGAVLSLPLLLMVVDQPLFWLPMLAIHLLLFSAFTLRSRLDNVDRAALRRTLPFILPGKIIGVFGLLSLPNQWLLAIIYGITAFYGLLWLAGVSLRRKSHTLDRLMLFGGGYFSGTSLSGAPLVVAVYAATVARRSLRDTLFVLWFLLVSIKLATFVWFGIELQLASSIILIPVTAIGHVAGLKLHDYLLDNDRLAKRFLGCGLLAISALGIMRVLQ